MAIKSLDSVVGNFLGQLLPPAQTTVHKETFLEAGASLGGGATKADPTAGSPNSNRDEHLKGSGADWNSSNEARADSKCDSRGGDIYSNGSNAAAGASCSMQRSMGKDAG